MVECSTRPKYLLSDNLTNDPTKFSKIVLIESIFVLAINVVLLFLKSYRGFNSL